jgi:hypothetical protein
VKAIRLILHRSEPEHPARRRTDPGFQPPQLELTEEQENTAKRLPGRHRRRYVDQLEISDAQAHLRYLRGKP